MTALKQSSQVENTANDTREALFNELAQGPAAMIQLPRERITTLHGILLDLDPGLLRPGNPYFPPAADPRAFLENINPVLGRHPLARHAEVRASGTGLHLILWLAPAIELHSDAEQQRWAAIVGAVQCSLPTDPQCPGITALTRPVGSVNSKNGATVEVLRGGTPLDPNVVEEFAARLAAAPFREVAQALLGAHRVNPCPVCKGQGTRLDVLERVGRCYGGCGTVTIEQLYDCLFLPSEARPVRKDAGEKKKAAGSSTKEQTSATKEKTSAPKVRKSATARTRTGNRAKEKRDVEPSSGE